MNDKVKHLIVGAFICFLVAVPFGTYWAVGLTLLAGVLREGWNLYHGGKFDWQDIVATVLGAVPGLGIWSLVQFLGWVG